GDFFRHGFEGGFVLVDHHVALAAGDGHGGDFPVEAAVFAGGAGTAQRFHRVSVLLFTGEGVFLDTAFRKHTHGRAALVGVFQAVQRHVVVDGGVAVTVTLTATQQKIGGIAHAFLA